jgi:preprotein translocase subunit Sec63
MDGLAPEPPVSIAPYAVLEIERGATPAEVRTAYKKLALRYHPGSYSSILLIFLTKTSDSLYSDRRQSGSC